MFDHVTLGAADREATCRFYATVLAALGRRPNRDDPTKVEWGDLSIQQAADGRPVTTGLHVAFAAPSHAHVDAFHRAGVQAGYEDDGAPGPRPEYAPDYYGAFLRDPDGNSAEAVVHGDRRGPVIDHLWIRVADRERSVRVYDALGAVLGFGPGAERPGRTFFTAGGDRGTFSLVDGETPTAPFHLAFAAPDRAAVDAFHDAGLGAGCTDNGAGGERPAYHPGYYGAFLLDPDGHNVEAVVHEPDVSSS